jgi:hypothetical protein
MIFEKMYILFSAPLRSPPRVSLDSSTTKRGLNPPFCICMGIIIIIIIFIKKKKMKGIKMVGLSSGRLENKDQSECLDLQVGLVMLSCY